MEREKECEIRRERKSGGGEKRKWRRKKRKGEAMLEGKRGKDGGLRETTYGGRR